jgi:hypothetical protein
VIAFVLPSGLLLLGLVAAIALPSAVFGAVLTNEFRLARRARGASRVPVLIDFVPAAVRGELDLDWEDPRHGRPIIRMPGESFWRDPRTGNVVGNQGSLGC